MNVIELRQTKALLIPDVQALIKRCVEQSNLLCPYGFDSIAKDIVDFVQDPMQFMFLGAEGGAFKSVMAGYLPVGNLFPYPTVVMFYNEGSRALSRATQEACMDFINAAGYTKLLACNTSGRDDNVWQRGLTPEGATSRLVGSLALFEVE